MSHYTLIKTQFTEAGALIAALIQLGYRQEQILSHQDAAQLDDYNGVQTEKRGHVVIKREHVGKLCNDIGFDLQNAEAHICDFAKTRAFNARVRDQFGGHGPAFLERLADEYAANILVSQAVAEGREYEVQREADRIRVFVGA